MKKHTILLGLLVSSLLGGLNAVLWAFDWEQQRVVYVSPAYEQIFGRSAALLCDGLPAWEGHVAVGMVAGHVPRGVGRLLAAVDAQSDGTVGIAETRLPGLCDHCLVAASHSGLVLSPEAARQAVAFLRNGGFDHAATAPAV